mmetsp:Transcript_10641/g.26026  ORF Transcript_10641/g.26026 Transcript_10641/m.26026 type:complete len:400 (-) Transcript_10641:360-1559(-)|eukprot:CAMPEP_0178982522 /NCGR_PEP_ID=MMETSP0795-20121207/543_1 /TAXON_ID=88552 /ORGANISM="Amoebophrya sp., Strain Ameob2" /LENGTH=399 /DNA_ID=CAMNT_0020673177 /DNA_START=240 /DNA_END=1439 /DNA_ORIENTATION=-
MSSSPQQPTDARSTAPAGDEQKPTLQEQAPVAAVSAEPTPSADADTENLPSGRASLLSAGRFKNKGRRGDAEDANAPAADEDEAASFSQTVDQDHPLEDLRPAGYGRKATMKEAEAKKLQDSDRSTTSPSEDNCDEEDRKPGCPYERAKSSFLSKGTQKDKVPVGQQEQALLEVGKSKSLLAARAEQQGEKESRESMSRKSALLSDAASKIGAEVEKSSGAPPSASSNTMSMSVGDHRKSYSVGGAQNLLASRGAGVADMPRHRLSSEEEVFLQGAAGAAGTARPAEVVRVTPITLAEAVVGSGSPSPAANVNPFLEPNTRPGSELFVYYILPLFFFFMMGVAAVHFFFGRHALAGKKGRISHSAFGSLAIDAYAATKKDDEEGESHFGGCERGADDQI